MSRISALLLSAIALVPLAQVAAQTPTNAPRAVSFGDTLGANFIVADSATASATISDFDFLQGTWEFTFQQRRPDGTFSPAFTGHWFAEKKRTANGFLEDHFRGDNSNTTIAAGTWTYRVFNPRRKLWEMQGVGSESGQWAPGLCWSDAGNRYVIQWYGSSIVRIRYFNITADSFLWRADISNDRGKSWQLDYWTMSAKRFAK
ncbi:MAG: hypothetical protein V4558_09015 [Gemmatimonadota bacterium]